MRKINLLFLIIFIHSAVPQNQFTHIKTMTSVDWNGQDIDLFGLSRIRSFDDNSIYLIFQKLNKVIKMNLAGKVVWIYQRTGTGPGGLKQPVDIFEYGNDVYIANSGRFLITVLDKSNGKYKNTISLKQKLISPYFLYRMRNFFIIKPMTIILPKKFGGMENSILLTSVPIVEGKLQLKESRDLKARDFGDFEANAIINHYVSIGKINQFIALAFQYGDHFIYLYDENVTLKDRIEIPVDPEIRKKIKKTYQIPDDEKAKNIVPKIYDQIIFGKDNFWIINGKKISIVNLNGKIQKKFLLSESFSLYEKTNKYFYCYNDSTGELKIYDIAAVFNTLSGRNSLATKNSTQNTLLYFLTEGSCNICLKFLKIAAELYHTYNINVKLIVLPEDSDIKKYQKFKIPLVIDINHVLFKKYNKKLETKFIYMKKQQIAKTGDFIEISKIHNVKELYELIGE
jgi:hypothetical protein